ncbi:MAG: GYD domain-containing protein [Pseudonocardiaceae bacterium]
MAKYAVFFSYTPEAWSKMISNPGDRAAAVRSVLESLGGRLETMYFMFGERDGFVIADLPDAESAAAVSITVASSGAFRNVQTHQLIAPEDLPGVLEKAGSALGSYRPPGS